MSPDSFVTYLPDRSLYARAAEAFLKAISCLSDERQKLIVWNTNDGNALAFCFRS